MLNEKQKKFCLEYIGSGNATKSAINAGYSKKTSYSIGQRLLKKDEIKDEIVRLNAKIENEKIMNAVEMQTYLTSVVRGESEEEVLMSEGVEKGITETVRYKKTASINDRIKAVNTLAKMQGVLDSGSNVNVVVPVFTDESNLQD